MSAYAQTRLQLSEKRLTGRGAFVTLRVNHKCKETYDTTIRAKYNDRKMEQTNEVAQGIDYKIMTDTVLFFDTATSFPPLRACRPYAQLFENSF